MAACSFSQQLSAYHDGELDAPRRQAMEQHLQSCSACEAELAELQKMSQWLAASPQPRLSQMSLHRLHANTYSAMDQGLMRIARTISAIAACVLIASSAWLVYGKPGEQPVETATSASIPPWVDVTLASNRDAASVDASTPAAAWYLASASPRSDDLP